MSTNCQCHRRRGAIAVLAAFAFVLVGAMAAFAIDIGHILYTRAKLGSAAENAAMAAVNHLPDGSAAAADARHIARLNYDGQTHVLANSDIQFGLWDRDAREFTSADPSQANAVRVTTRLSEETGNPLRLFLGGLLGKEWVDVSASGTATKQVFAAGAGFTAPSEPSVYVTSTKDLSNVVLEFADGTHQKFEKLRKITAATFSGTGEHEGKEIVGVWIKSGTNDSGDGPGYGERVANGFDGQETHGANEANGDVAHVTATFMGGQTVRRIVH